MSARVFIGADEIAKMLELGTKAMFLTRRNHLEELGFPNPIAWMKSPMRWRRDDVQNWLDGAGRNSADLYLLEPTPSAHRKVVMGAMAKVQ